MNGIGEKVYEANYKLNTEISEIPYVGSALLGLTKIMCDYVVNPLVVGGTHAGCDAADDVYHGLPADPYRSGRTDANARNR